MLAHSSMWVCQSCILLSQPSTHIQSFEHYAQSEQYVALFHVTAHLILAMIFDSPTVVEVEGRRSTSETAHVNPCYSVCLRVGYFEQELHEVVNVIQLVFLQKDELQSHYCIH